MRLGQDVDRTGRLADEALDRVFVACEEYAALVDAHDVAALRFVATSAARDADNSEVFVDGVRQRLGVTPEVVSGDEEAQLTFDGATRSLTVTAPPVAVLDIGGGSTELIVGDAHGHVRAARSLDIGSVRLTERLMPSDPPTRAEVDAAVSAVDEALDTLPSYGVHVGDAPHAGRRRGHRHDRRHAAARAAHLGPGAGPPRDVPAGRRPRPRRAGARDDRRRAWSRRACPPAART